MRNALTIDVEEYFQVAAFRKQIPVTSWGDYESRLDRPIRYLLESLDATGVRATFFILGCVAERSPHIVAEIVAGGHEVGSHGMQHQLVYEQSEDVFRRDVTESRKLLREMTGQNVTAYRAPSWSITSRTPWAYNVLREAGYELDSSLFPIPHDIHGNASGRADIHTIETASGPLLEFPAAVVSFLGCRVPAGGGGYFRLFPYLLTRRLLRSINSPTPARPAAPFVFYVHPWEFDAEQPRVVSAPWKSRFRHYTGLRTTAAKWERLLADFTFAPITEVAAENGE
ncbi:MAG: XrtA system polysaccharide deacetylase [Thermoguttaceae bacterium]